MIEITGLCKRFGRRLVLDDLALTLATGDRVALVGSNGAGKTTLIRCLLGEYRCQGHLRVAGLDPRSHRASLLPRVGFVPQLPPPLPLTVGELLALTSRLARVPAAAMATVAGELGLDVAEQRRQVFHRLSGGMKQKLLIAIALGRRPDLLIMDEPAANLDPEARRRFYALLETWGGGGLMLLSSHRVDEIAGLVNRVVEMDGGRVTRNQGMDRSGEAGAMLSCSLTLSAVDEPCARDLVHWGFTPDAQRLAWQGELAEPDRLRFLGLLSRFSERVVALSWSPATQREPT
ncbi:MAG: ATP-binding cassette domain-containing protein [Magnetococcus sp. WYHC-3]